MEMADGTQPGHHPQAVADSPADRPPQPSQTRVLLDPEGIGADGGPRPTSVHFLVLMPEYAQEHVTVAMQLPASIDEAIQLVDEARDAQNRHRFGRLVPALVQPALGFACLIAVPDWPFEGVPALYVCFAPYISGFSLWLGQLFCAPPAF